MRHEEMLDFLKRSGEAAAADHDGTAGSAAAAAECAACFDTIAAELHRLRTIAYTRSTQHPDLCDCAECIPF